MKTPLTMPYAHNAGLWIVAASLLFGLAGCATPQPSSTDLRTAEAPNPIQVSREKLTHTVRYAAGSLVPDAGEIVGLNKFLLDADTEHGDEIQLQRTAAPIDDKRGARLAATLARHGLQPSIGIGADIPSGEIRVTIERYVAGAPDCPNWSKAPGNDFENKLHSDFGCSTSNNLAAMVADPHDLIAGRAMGPASGDPALAAIHRYRTGKVVPVPDDSSQTSTPAATGSSSGTSGQ